MTGRLHIAHVLPSFEWGGTQALVVQFAAEAHKMGVDVTVISLSPDRATPYAKQLRDHGAKVVFLEGKYALSPMRLVRLAQLLRQENVDLVHAHLTKPNTLAPMAGWLAGCPVVAGLHTLPDLSTSRARLRAKCEAFSVRRASAAISCASSIAERENHRFAPTAIKVVSNPAPCLPRSHSARVTSQPLHFISIGRLSPEKGYDILLQAAATLRQQGLRFRLSIVGDGSEKDALQQQIDACQLNDTVTLTGPRSDIPELLREADIYVSSSRFEGLSIAMLEAMAHGLPVIATDVGDTAEAMTPETGQLIAPDSVDALENAMTSFINNPSAIAPIGAAARNLIKETRSPDVWAKRYLDIYRETLTRFGRQAA